MKLIFNKKTRNRGFTRTPKTWVSGFTILESLVAIMILSLSIAGAFSAIQQSLSQSTISKGQIQAFYLAQEAIEIIRNKRDSNQLTKINTGTGNWLAGIAQSVSDPCWFGKTCMVDANPIPPTLTSCSGGWGTCNSLKQNPSTYMYNYASGNPTNFKREIQLEIVRTDPVSLEPTEIAVTVRVSWTKGIIPFKFEAKTLLFNWI